MDDFFTAAWLIPRYFCNKNYSTTTSTPPPPAAAAAAELSKSTTATASASPTPMAAAATSTNTPPPPPPISMRPCGLDNFQELQCLAGSTVNCDRPSIRARRRGMQRSVLFSSEVIGRGLPTARKSWRPSSNVVVVLPWSFDNACDLLGNDGIIVNILAKVFHTEDDDADERCLGW